MKRPLSLKAKLTGYMIAIVLMTVALISLTANFVIGRQFSSYLAQQQQAQAQSIATNLSLQYDAQTGRWSVDYMHGIGMYALSEGYIVKVYDGRGNPLWDAQACDMGSCMRVMNEITARMEQRYPQSPGAFITQSLPLVQGDRQIGTVGINYYGPYFLDEHDAYFLDTLNAILYSTGALALLMSALTGILWARRIARPIHDTAAAVDKIAGGQRGTRLAGRTGTRELDALTHSVNQLAASIESQEALRSQLTSDVAHELRTPLTTLHTHIEAMLMGVWQPTPQRLKSNLDEVARVSKIVSDLEGLASADSGALKLDRAEANLTQIAQAAVQGFAVEIQKKRLTVRVEGPDVPAHVDRDRMAQVLVNLISNAVKYTPDGGAITIGLALEGDEAHLWVEDTGVGISAQDLPLVFQRFYRADKSRNRSTGGAGIGLAIVKSIVEAHGGSVQVRSAPGQGSCFHVRIPSGMEKRRPQ